MAEGEAGPAKVSSAGEKLAAGMQVLLEGARANTGQTPQEVVWSRNKARLYHYVPVTSQQLPVPILFVYALINRPYILDLMPGNSFVEFLVGQGFQVYLLDWGIPGDEDTGLGFEHYVLDYLPAAVKRMLRHSGARDFTLFGYCMGGTMAAMYAALYPERPLKNLVLLTTPIAFPAEEIGLLGLWTREQYLDADHLADAFGLIPAALIDMSTRMLQPVANTAGTYVSMWERINRQGKSLEAWLAMNKWVNDGIPFPGAAFRQWLRDFYQRDGLVKGEIRLRGRQVDLRHITCSLLNIAATRDHIVPLPQTETTLALIDSQDAEYLTVDAGHVGLLAGSEARNLLWPRVQGWLVPRSR